MKKLDLNMSEDLFRLKESLNNVIDAKIAEQKLSEKINEIDNLSFGEYKALFEDIMPDLSDSVEGKKLIASYVKLIKENKSVNVLYKILESKNYSELDSTATAYAITDILEGVDRNLLKEGEKQMYNLFKESVKYVKNGLTCENIDNVLSTNATVNNAISYLTHNSDKNNIKQLNERVSCIKVLSDLVNESIKKTNNCVYAEKHNQNAIDEINNLIENAENSWEREVLKDISLCAVSNGDKKELFETYKTDCINVIDSIVSEDVVERSRLHGMKEQLQEKAYREKSHYPFHPFWTPMFYETITKAH